MLAVFFGGEVTLKIDTALDAASIEASSNFPAAFSADV
jgi:hypothetical protein